ncbi:hypothetical protein RVV18_002940 [Burkholderia ambifaria]|nr:hypothetical protein [Burkholderia ambifaria]
MTIARAKTVAEAALDELAGLLRDGAKKIDDFTCARLDRSARNGMHADPQQAHQVLGILAAMRWDDRQMDEHFHTAMRIARSALVNANYASTLELVDRFQEAADMYEKALSAHPTDLSLLRKAVSTSWQAGQWERSLELAQTLKERSPQEEIQHFFGEQLQAIEILRRAGVEIEVVERLHAALYTFLRSKQVWTSGSSMTADKTPGEEAVYVTVNVGLPLQEVRALDEELTPVLFDAVEEFPLGSLYIGLGAGELLHVA